MTLNHKGEALAGCPCALCEAFRRSVRRNRKLRQMGVLTLAPLPPVRAHLHRLIDRGWSRSQIAKASGVPASTISEILTRSRAHINAGTSTAILAVSGPAQHERLAAFGTIRRLQALAAIGWPMREVCLRAGLAERFGTDLVRDQRTTYKASARAIARVYDELSMTPAPQSPVNKHVGTFARNQGWPPPLAWLDIDDPNETPTGWAYEPLARNSSSVHRLEVITEMADRGAGVSEVCAYFKISPKSLERWLERQRLRPLFNTLKAREHIDGNHRNSRPGTRNPYYGDVA